MTKTNEWVWLGATWLALLVLVAVMLDQYGSNALNTCMNTYSQQTCFQIINR